MANYETMKAAFRTMDEETAVTIFRMELNEAARSRDYEREETITHAFFDCRLTDLHSGSSFNFNHTARSQPFRATFQGPQHHAPQASYYINHALRGAQSLTQVRSTGSTSFPRMTGNDFPAIGSSDATPIHQSRVPQYGQHTHGQLSIEVSNMRGTSLADVADNYNNLFRRTSSRPALFESANQRNPDQIQDRALCISCYETFSPPEFATSTACKHSYCRKCARNMFEKSLSDITLFPPSCCYKELPLKDFRALLTKDAAAKCDEKKAELKAKGFCSNKTCSTALFARDIVGDIGKCFVCQTMTCLKCKSSAHYGENCPENKDEKAVLDLAQKAGWQRCFSCHTMVSMTRGCNHMKCVCKAQWCYRCGTRWHGCSCPPYGRPGETEEQIQAGLMAELRRDDRLDRIAALEEAMLREIERDEAQDRMFATVGQHMGYERYLEFHEAQVRVHQENLDLTTLWTDDWEQRNWPAPHPLDVMDGIDGVDDMRDEQHGHDGNGTPAIILPDVRNGSLYPRNEEGVLFQGSMQHGSYVPRNDPNMAFAPEPPGQQFWRQRNQEEARNQAATVGTSATTPGPRYHPGHLLASSDESMFDPSLGTKRGHTDGNTTFASMPSLPLIPFGRFQGSDSASQRRAPDFEQRVREARASASKLLPDHPDHPRNQARGLFGRNKSAARRHGKALHDQLEEATAAGSQDNQPDLQPPTQMVSRPSEKRSFMTHLRQGLGRDRETKEKV